VTTELASTYTQRYVGLEVKVSSLVLFDSPLLHRTSDDWCECVLANFDEFLIDHADCERKAAGSALSLVRRYPEKTKLIEPMIALAREELAHYHDVHKIMLKRGVIGGKESSDAYAKQLRSHARDPREQRFLDLLLLSGLIEARAHDRLEALAPRLQEQSLRKFYTHLANIEAGHHKIFFQTARHYYPEPLIQKRLKELIEVEDKLFCSLELRPRIH
jgi:tRNA-(ms[2]io[6]A)-hydroxylase